MTIGAQRWAIAEGYIPGKSHGPAPQMESHETLCLLNAGDRDAHVEIMVYFTDRAPVGPYRYTVPARRTRHLRFNEFTAPERLPRDTDFASVISADSTPARSLRSSNKTSMPAARSCAYKSSATVCWRVDLCMLMGTSATWNGAMAAGQMMPFSS